MWTKEFGCADICRVPRVKLTACSPVLLQLVLIGVFFQVCMRVWDSNSCTSPVYVWQQENMCFINLHFIKLTITIPCGCSMIRERQGAELHVSNLETRLCHVIHTTWQAICVFFCKLTFLVEENKSRCLYRELFIFLQRIHNTYHGEI